MRCCTLLSVTFFAALALAQNNAINIPQGQSTINAAAGQPLTITWSNPSSGTVTIKLQSEAGTITPETGYVLAGGVPASAGTATFTIPANVNQVQYTIEIVDDTNSSNMNFSPNFGISGATGTATAPVGTGTGSATGSATAAASTGSITGSTNTASASGSSASQASASSASASSASSASAGSSGSSVSLASKTSAAASSAATSAPTSNAAAPLRIQGGLVAALIGGVAML